MKLLTVVLFIAACAGAVSAQDNRLSPVQLESLKTIKLRIEKQAAPAALGLALTAKKIYANMLADKEDQRLRKKLNKDLHRYAGQLLDLKGRSFRETLAILTPEQKKLVLAELQKPGAQGDLSEVVDRVFGITTK